MSDPDDLKSFWKDLGHPIPGCSRCGDETNVDNSAITWRCQQCGHLVCRKCTRMDPIEKTYLSMTLCSEACWEAAGKPDD
jgi:predicted RNA-binding Zn-ribbon protein involved in translation (DUF1610 family)